MGLCASANLSKDDEKAKTHSKRLRQQMQVQYQEEQAVHKLLLLGAGESGKSTLYKQMISIYVYKKDGFPLAERKAFKHIIRSNIINCAVTLCKYTSKFFPAETKEGEEAAAFISDQKTEHDISDELYTHLKNLWSDPGVVKTFGQRSQFQLTDSCDYFFEALDRICADDYIPTEQDVMRSRVRTTGIVENQFDIDGNQFKMFDVGGQRNERKKWLHCFENVTAVLFVAAISAFDQRLYEDENTNRMVEALNLFAEICNSRWFKKTSIILFLNKKDLFQKKLASGVQLNVCFDGKELPEYTGDNSYEDAKEFVVDMFLSRAHEKSAIYHHVTTATDRDNTTTVFNAIKDTIIKESLKQAGLLGYA